jgi:hypothetical protein
MKTLRRLLYLAVGALAWPGTALGQSPEDQRAADETEFPGLRLVAPRYVDSRLTLLGIQIGYVEQDVRLGTTGKYFCGGLSLARLPYESVRKLGLRYVILCGGAKSGERGIGGIPVPPLNVLMLNVA